ncbi:MAG: lamin tail domain-containing protein [Thermoflexales bacterium]|nr:lamin tail domain-containing protein [Thermoflexales bacterium]
MRYAITSLCLGAAALALSLGVLQGRGLRAEPPDPPAGNSYSLLLTPYSLLPTIVINEVAWGGTAASSSDEWVELKNNTSTPITLSGWTLTNTGSVSIILDGVVPAGGFFLLERSGDDTVSDVPADQFFSNALRNPPTPDWLVLRDETGALVDSANGDGGAWPAGSAGPDYFSMERIDALGPDADANWASNDGVTRCGLDAAGAPLNGTPKAANSASSVVSPAPDLVVAKAAPVSVAAGVEITYTISLRNVGQSPAANVRVTDSLPQPIAFSRQSAPFPFSRQGQTLVWEVGSVPSDSAPLSWTLSGRLDLGFAGLLTNAVEVSPVPGESVVTNNAAQAATQVGSSASLVLLNGVLYDGYQLNDADESIEIINLGPSPVDLSGWRLTRIGSSGVVFPAYSLGVERRAWASRNAQAFYASFGFWPQFAAGSPPTGVLALAGSWPGLGNAGGDVQLLDAEGRLADRLVYVDASYRELAHDNCGLLVDGWWGPAVRPYGIGAVEGQILARIPDEQSGLPVPDSDTAADWIQNTGHYTAARRVLYPGWDMDLFFWPLTSTAPATVTLGIAPDSAYDVVLGALRSARRSIEIEAYTVSQYGLAQELAAQARAGLSVTLLLEGEPAGGIDTQSLWGCQQIEAAGGQCWFMHDYHPTGYRIFDRYDMVHAKFIILDRQRLLVSSQNFSASGLPDDDKVDGSYGSRGYVVLIDSPELTARAGAIFERDLDPTRADIARWPNESFGFGAPPASYVPVTASGGFTSPVYFPTPQTFTDATHFELFTAPEAALRQSDALLGLLARAGEGDEILVEQLYEHADWGDPLNAPNLRLQAYLDAARRGARVRVLLNSGTFGQEYFDLSKNISATAYLNTMARREGIDLHARMGDPLKYGIHSKLALVRSSRVDDHSSASRLTPYIIPSLSRDVLRFTHYVSHIGSLNGSEASSKVNRELAVQVESQGLYDALARVFWIDWHLSGSIFLPLVLKGYPPLPPPPPVDYLVISEVYYSSTVSLQWVELYNPTGRTLDMAGYKLGDAETAERFEGMYRFPDGALLGPGGVVVVAYDGTQVVGASFQMCQACGGSVPVMPKYAAWGEGDWWLAGHGDQVLLLGPDDVPIDVVVYGDAVFPSVVPHPGVLVFTHSLERRPAMYDTDDCSRDFLDVYPPEPGEVNNTLTHITVRFW